MKDLYSEQFINALKNGKEDIIRKTPKSDLHNHFVMGGSREYIKTKKGIEILPCQAVLQSMQEMDAWNAKYLGEKFDSTEMRKFLIEATFEQAKNDGIKVLEIGEDVWGLSEYFQDNIRELIETFEEINSRIAPEMELRLQIGLSRHCPIDYLSDCLKKFWGQPEFYSIDLYGDELAQPIENFNSIYEQAKEYGLKRKAHIGEWGTADDIRKGVELLHLDEVQHGIAAAESEDVIEFLKEKKVRLNITPTSNILLGRVKELKLHPIQELYRSGVDVTINSDDILIFDSDVTKEYLRLYNSGCLNEDELDHIRVNGLGGIL